DRERRRERPQELDRTRTRPREPAEALSRLSHPDAEPVVLHPVAGGRAVGGLALTRSAEQGKETLVDDASVPGARLAAAEEAEHRLPYATPELVGPLHISGTARITIRLAANKPAADLSVWLVSLPWEQSWRITDNISTRGW